jgi:hypothetical protein
MGFIKAEKGFIVNNNDNYWLINRCLKVKCVDLVVFEPLC